MTKRVANRREFLGTVGAAGAVSVLAGTTRGAPSPANTADASKLAIDGGEPVRKDTLYSRPYGPQFYDEVEKQE